VEKDQDDQLPVECPLPPSPPVEAEQISDLMASSDLKVEDALQASGSDISDGYSTCDAVICDDDRAPESQPPEADVSGPGFFHRAKHLMSAASKYRLRCQCGATNCRQYLY